MPLSTLSPVADWDASAHADAVEALAAVGEPDRVLIWCDDGCKDCQALLPAFGAALEAAGVSDDQVVQYAVERLPEGRKRGPEVEAYGIERIPTVVIERDGEEVARFVEGDGDSIVEALADQLSTAAETR